MDTGRSRPALLEEQGRSEFGGWSDIKYQVSQVEDSPTEVLWMENRKRCLIFLLYPHEWQRRYGSLTSSHISLHLTPISKQFSTPLRRDISWQVVSIATKTMNVLCYPFHLGQRSEEISSISFLSVCTFTYAMSRCGWLLPGGAYKANGILQMPDRRQVFSSNRSTASFL